MAQTPTSPDTTPDPAVNGDGDTATLSAKTRKKADAAKVKADKAAHDMSAAAKKHPYTSAAIATGALAAIGGAAFGIFQFTGKKKDDGSKPPHVRPSAT